jgi:hypothetical protein
MKAYLVAVNLLVQAHHSPESAIADALNGILTPDVPAFPLWPTGTVR